MSAYYNEVDAYAAQWLRNLIAAGLAAPGNVDERSIVAVRADDVRGYEQCHFFAGIGGWSIALRLAGWPDDRPVWTGSCPCQPLSSAGQRKGHVDERHLWPAFHGLIAECAPAVVFGEQVGGADGREWFSAVRADLEATGYAVGAADLCAAGVGAPHIRQRLWFVANAASQGRRAQPQRPAGTDGRPAQEPGRLCDAGELGDAIRPRLQEQRGVGSLPSGESGTDAREASERASASAGFWAPCDWLLCTDGKARPAQPGLQPLAHGIQRRASKLRAYGNAIVPQTAEAFIRACA